MVGPTQPMAIVGDGLNPDARHDVTVVITEYYEQDGQEASRITTVECNKAVLLRSADHFVRLWRKEPKADLVNFDRRGDTLDGLEVWLGAFHGRIPQDLIGISRAQLWHIIEIGNHYGFYLNDYLKDFFAGWYARNVHVDTLKPDIARELALPCYVFDYAEGFADVTKWLVYNSPGPVTERKPVHFRFKHLNVAPPDFIGSMNQARGRLKTILHSRLWIHARNLLRLPHSCDCWKVTISEYLSELVNLNVFPLEDFTLRTSICEITQRIRQFKHQSAAPDCADCNINWIGVVFGGVRATEAYFDGLCLDCMDRSRVKDGDKNHWLQCGAVDKRWDSRCRIKHGEPTWYASWLGRNDHKQKLLDMRHAAEDVPGIRFDTEKVTVEPPSVDEAKVHSPAEEAKPDSLVEEPEVESLTEDAKEDASQESNADEAKKFYELQGSEIMD